MNASHEEVGDRSDTGRTDSAIGANSTVHIKPKLRWLTYLLLLPLIALATIGFGCISLVCGLWDGSGRQQHAIARAWANVLLFLSLSPVTLIGRSSLHDHQVAVYASNHLSYYGHTGSIRQITISVPNLREAIALEGAFHRLVSQ